MSGPARRGPAGGDVVPARGDVGGYRKRKNKRKSSRRKTTKRDRKNEYKSFSRKA